ncbi:site-specific integrase [Pedobacter miscanthi]|uniref:site-specific integrase n=1 Tax=Pedobacter miscanthi TaxID=2259170 RepID=UPI0029316E42|nr:site-specific integrase [Pedobacter miscanthi]
MAEIKLNLREPNAEKETPINVIIRYNGQRLVYSSGKRIHPGMWDNLSQKAKRSKDSTSSELLNGNLRLITQGVYEEIERYQKNNQQRFPEPKELKAILDLRFSRVAQTTSKDFFEFIEWFSLEYAPKKQLIKSNETSATSPNTLKTYLTTLRLLKIFAKAKGSFDFKDINLEWYQSFTEWCNSTKNYNPSTIGKHIKVIKTWLRKAEDDGLHTSTFYKHQDFRKPSYLSETIYLNRDELALIQKLDLSNHVELDRIRDLFLVGAWTGLRFSDFNRLSADNISDGFIRMKTSKTSSQAVIPINAVVSDILAKYDNNIPNGYANQYMNRQLKVICKMAKIQSSEIKVDFVNGKKRVNKVQKWQLVSTHTARRSFATNLYGLVPNNTIMAITTHKTEAAFLRYLRKSNDEHAQILKQVLDRM